MNGWIKIHRKIKENPIYSNSIAVHCWIECLLRASHKEREVFFHRKKICLKPGQFVMGREEFGRSISVSPSTVWYWIHQFKVDSMVDIKKTSKGTVVSIINWIDYQEVDSTLDNKKTTKKQQKNTNKKEKKKKNEEYIQWLGEFNRQMGTNYKSISDLKNFEYWRSIYSLEEMIQALSNIPNHNWLSDKAKPSILLRQKDTSQNPVDRFGELLSIKINEGFK